AAVPKRSAKTRGNSNRGRAWGMVNAMGLFLSALVAARCEIFKSCVLADEGHAAGADGPVTLLADNQFGDTLVLGVGVVDLVPVDEHDHVRVLLDRTGLAQVRVDRTLVRALLQGAVELGQCHH